MKASQKTPLLIASGVVAVLAVALTGAVVFAKKGKGDGAYACVLYGGGGMVRPIRPCLSQRAEAATAGPQHDVCAAPSCRHASIEKN